MRALSWIVGILLVLTIGGYFTFEYMKAFTKSKSPEDTAIYRNGDFEMQIDYSRPSVKGRKIFGELVPYGKVWRVGANEPTTIKFNRKIIIEDIEVGAGTYSIWVIPEASQWTFILNKEVPKWGISFSGTASRDPKHDVLLVNVPVRTLDQTVETFTIQYEYDVNISFLWENTKVMVPVMF